MTPEQEKLEKLKKVLEKSAFIKKWKELGVVNELFNLSDEFDVKLDSLKDSFAKDIEKISKNTTEKSTEIETTFTEKVSFVSEDVQRVENNLKESIDTKLEKSEYEATTEKLYGKIDTKLDRSEYQAINEDTIVERLYAKIEIPELIKGVHYFDGEHGADADEEAIYNRINERIGELLLGENIVDSINLLPTDNDDYKIDVSHIKGIQNTQRGRSGLMQVYHDTTLTGLGTPASPLSAVSTAPAYGSAYDIPYMNGTGTGFTYSDTYFQYNLNRLYLDLQTINGSEDGALYMTAKAGSTIFSNYSRTTDILTKYVLNSELFTSGFGANKASWGTDGLEFGIKYGDDNSNWGRALYTDINDYIRNPQYINGGSSDLNLDILNGTLNAGNLSSFAMMQVTASSVTFGDPGGVSTGSYFDFNLGTNLFTFWGLTGYRALQIDLSGFTCLTGDPDNLVGGTFTSVDPAGLLGYGAGWSLVNGSNTYVNIDTVGVTLQNNSRIIFDTSGSSTTTNGHMWYDATQETNSVFTNGIQQQLVGCIFTQTADKTIANTTTETTLFGTGVGTLTLPASFFQVGKMIKIHIHGYHSSAGNPNITIKIKLGSTVVAQGTVASGNGSTNGFYFDSEITCRSTGSSGTVSAGGEFEETHNSGSTLGIVQTGTTTINTTTSQVLDVTFTWGTASASNTITSQESYVEIKN